MADRARRTATHEDVVAAPEGARNIRRDRMAKPDVYARVGVGWLWRVDPAARLVEVFELVDGRYTRAQVVGGDTPSRLSPFEAVELDLGAWWLPRPDGE